MSNVISFTELLEAIVPISRFNRGEANKIFSEVSGDGLKIVVKNNKPTCVLISPEKYEELMETIENYNLLVEAEQRTREYNYDGDCVSHEQVMEKLNITEKDLANIEVDID